MIRRISINRKTLNELDLTLPAVRIGYERVINFVTALDHFYSFGIPPKDEYGKHPELGGLFYNDGKKRASTVLRECFSSKGVRLTVNFGNNTHFAGVITDIEIWDKAGNGRFHLQVTGCETNIRLIDSRY